MAKREFTGVPALRIIPGDILRQELDARGWSQRAFAEKIRRPEQLVSEIIRGKKRITAETALDFAEALGIGAEFWLNLEVNYELDQARSRRDVRLARAGQRMARSRPRRQSA